MTARGLLATVVVLWAAWARAQAPDLTALGQREFELGKQEFNLGHYDKALEHFENSYRLSGAPELLYNLGHVQRQLFERTRRQEHLEQAIERFKGYLANAKYALVPGRKDQVQKALRDAEDRLAKERAAHARGEEALALGEDFLGSGRLADAAAQVEAYEGAPGNERAGVVRAALLRAALKLRENDRDGAVQAYARALSLKRALPVPADPAQAEAFEAALALLGDAPELSVAHTPPASIRAGAPVELVYTKTRDPLGLVVGLRASYRLAGGKAFSTLPLAPVGRQALPREFTLAVPPDSRIEYYADVIGRNQAVLQHLGTDALPFAIQVQPAKKPSVARKWWFWTTLVGVTAVAAAGVGLGVALTQPPGPIDVGFNTGAP